METTAKTGKTKKIVYWIATVWLCLGMTSAGIIQILQVKEETEMMTRLGYPLYILTLLGVWKLLGVIAMLMPKFPLVKEWAYAGFFFTVTGALYSHFAVSDVPQEFFGPSLLLVLTAVSWYTRPESKKINPVNG